MKKSVFITSALSCLTVLSCNSISPTITDNGNNAIMFKTEGLQADVSVKASAVTSLSSFYVAATAGKGNTYVWGPEMFSGSDTYKGTRYWPDQNPHYNFFASNITMKCEDGTTAIVEAKDNSTDIVCAYLPDAPHKSIGTLKFEHIFARIGAVTVGDVEGYTVTGGTVKLTPYTSGKYDVSGIGQDGRDAFWSDKKTSDEVTIATFPGTSPASDLYLIPGEYLLTAEYTLTLGDYSRKFTKQKEVTFTGGCINNISATLPKPGEDEEAAEISFRISITPWSTSDVLATF